MFAVGEAATVQLVPSQCKIAPAPPTAQPSLAEFIFTPKRSAAVGEVNVAQALPLYLKITPPKP
ncbi:MAG: hypothetical protein AAB692_02570, partial [Patescibacteria group bacterium]